MARKQQQRVYIGKKFTKGQNAIKYHSDWYSNPSVYAHTR